MNDQFWLGVLIGVAAGGWVAWAWVTLVALRRHRQMAKAWGQKPLLPTPKDDAATKTYVDSRIGDLTVTKLPTALPQAGGDGTKSQLDAASAPRFGRPELIVYRSADFELGMRCCGSVCGHRELIESEQVRMIPVIGAPEGAVVLCCAECEVTP